MAEVNGFKISVMVTQLGSTDTRQPGHCNTAALVFTVRQSEWVRVFRQVIAVYGGEGCLHSGEVLLFSVHRVAVYSRQ